MRATLYLCCFSFLFLRCSRNQESSTAFQSKQDLPQNSIALHQEEIAHAIRDIIENRSQDSGFLVSEQVLYSSFLIPQFYVNRDFQNAWMQHIDSLGLVNDFIQYIEEIEHHGLQPEHYHLESIKNLRDSIIDKNKPFNPINIAQLDLLLSDAFFILSSHLYHGKVETESLTATWNIRRDKPHLALDKKLEMLVVVKHPVLFMRRFYPQHPGYETMISEVKKLKSKLHEDFPVTILIPEGKHSIDLKSDSLYAAVIYKKLQLLGYIAADTLDYINDKEGLLEIVKLFQKTYGIRPDGQVGKNTIRALNHSIQDKIDAIYVNAERLRWLPDSLNTRHIMVNIADFTLDFISNRDTLISMRTVVGKDFRQTPVFNAKMTYLVFSPTWTVPPTIMKNDVIPAVAKNINYLKNHHMKIIDGHGNEINPSSIDWQRAKTRGSIPYRIRQEPGPHNALGRVKFMFPNKYNVYLHDTPSKELFDQDSRTFSSGCIRIDKPFELAMLLIDDSIKWSAEHIKSAMSSRTERTVSLKKPVDVYIFYLTAWSDGKQVYYRHDIYGRDEAILKALRAKK
jgi:L,D-transpeptidase YcbB